MVAMKIVRIILTLTLAWGRFYETYLKRKFYFTNNMIYNSKTDIQ